MPGNTKSESSQTSGKQESSTQNDPSAAAKGNACPVCEKLGRPPGPCRGHAEGGGGSEETSTADQGSGQALASTSGQDISTTAGQAVNIVTDYKGVDQQQYQSNQQIFTSEVISGLLSKVIENDRDFGIITIKLHCSSNSLSEEQRNELKEFVDTILKELDEFKKEKGISANCVTTEKDNKGDLRITLLTPTIYDAFIQRLASKNLLPTQQHSMNKDVDSMDEDIFKNEEKSSSIRPRSKK